MCVLDFIETNYNENWNVFHYFFNLAFLLRECRIHLKREKIIGLSY